MATSAHQKQGKFGPLQLVQVERTPEELLDLEIAEGFSALTSRKTGKRPRAWYAIAERVRHPGRAFARRVCEAKAHDVAREQVLAAIAAPLRRYVNRKYGVRADEFDLAS